VCAYIQLCVCHAVWHVWVMCVHRCVWVRVWGVHGVWEGVRGVGEKEVFVIYQYLSCTLLLPQDTHNKSLRLLWQPPEELNSHFQTLTICCDKIEKYTLITCTRSKKFSPKIKRDLGMACHTLPLRKSEETRGNAITQPRSHPIPKFFHGMGPRLGNSISPCFFTFF